jgi:putative membrane protein
MPDAGLVKRLKKTRRLPLDGSRKFCYNDGKAGTTLLFNLRKGVSEMGIVFGSLIALVVAAVVLLIVSRFNLGLKVDGFVSAIIAAIVIAIVTAIILWLLGLFGISVGAAGGILGWIVTIVVAAVVLIVAAKLLPGLTVAGFSGAVIAAIAIGVVGWIISWLLGLLGITV